MHHSWIPTGSAASGFLAPGGSGAGGATDGVRVTVLYDNSVFEHGTRSDWGFSCLIEGLEKTILFDTGTRPEILMHNVSRLGVDLHTLDTVVISHDHYDHTGGLLACLKVHPRVTVFLPASFPPAFVRRVEASGAVVRTVGPPEPVCEDAWLTGEMGDRIKEQGLVMKRPGGGILITGCSHPGIVTLIERAEEILGGPTTVVFGGFHLMDVDAEGMHDLIERFRERGVKIVGPTHCTGDEQIAIFREAFDEEALVMGTGRRLVLT